MSSLALATWAAVGVLVVGSVVVFVWFLADVAREVGRRGSSDGRRGSSDRNGR